MKNNKSSKDTSILIHVYGTDKPGISNQIFSVLKDSNYIISDIGQYIVNGNLLLSMIIDNSEDENKNTEILKDLLLVGKKNNIKIDFDIINNQSTKNNSKKSNYILTSTSFNPYSCKSIHAITEILLRNKINIESIRNDVTIYDKNKKIHSLEITTSIVSANDKKITSIKNQLFDIANLFKIDISFIKDDIYRTHRRLICFDMDSTFIQGELMDEMAKEMGKEKKVMKITEKAMKGLMDFDQSLLERVKMIKGISLEQINKITKQIKLANGIEELIKKAKKVGIKIAIISGGFTIFANQLKNKFDLDYVFANELEIKNNIATGNVLGDIVNAKKKAEYLKLICKKENISLQQSVAVGDGANDIEMLTTAGMGISFFGKESLKKKVSNHVQHSSMLSLIHLLNLKD